MAEVAPRVIDSLNNQKLHFIDIEGVRTRYYEDGAGEPLVLLAGGDIGSLYSLDCWSLNLSGLAQDFHVYALDKLGQGPTDNPKRDEDYTLEAALRHTYHFMRVMGITDAHIVGHSRGGLLATRLVLEYPELVKTLVLVDSRSTAPDHPDYPLGAFYAGLPRRTTVGPATRESVRIEPDAQAYRREQVTDDFISRMLEIALLPKTQEAQERVVALRDTIIQPTLIRTRQQTLRSIDEAGLPVPTLVIWGINDRSAPLVLGLQLFERICPRTPQAEMHVLNGAGHYCFRDQPEAFNRVVKGFCLR